MANNYFSRKVVLLDSLEGTAKAEKELADIKAEERNNNNNDVKIITDELDQIFLEESADECYRVYSNFINYKKSKEITISEYVLEFEHLYKNLIEYGMKLPDPVLTFKLLDGANI